MANPEKPDPALWASPQLRRALACRDICEVYRHLTAAGFTQRALAKLTGQSDSEVSEILSGRTVRSYDVLLRIAEGLGVPRGWLGLAYDEQTRAKSELAAHTGERSPLKEVDDDVRRRRLIALTGSILYGAPVLGEPGLFPGDTSATVPLPATVQMGDVSAVRAMTERMRTLGRAGQAGMPDVLDPITAKADRLLTVDADSDATARALRCALAEMHTLTGWCSYDMFLTDAARWHYARAMQLAADADDVTELVSAVRHTAWIDVEQGDPQSALKHYELGLIKLADSDPQLSAMLHVRSAYALALMGYEEGMRRALARAADCPPLDDPFERADTDEIRSLTQLTLGRVDVAEQYAVTSLRAWGPDDRRDSAETRITLARAHAIAGEPDAPRLAAVALDAVSELQSVRVRALLAPLERALASRRDKASADLVHRVREVRAHTHHQHWRFPDEHKQS